MQQATLLGHFAKQKISVPDFSGGWETILVWEGEIFQFIKMDNFCVVFEAFERIL